jgi:hypothetical protein
MGGGESKDLWRNREGRDCDEAHANPLNDEPSDMPMNIIEGTSVSPVCHPEVQRLSFPPWRNTRRICLEHATIVALGSAARRRRRQEDPSAMTASSRTAVLRLRMTRQRSSDEPRSMGFAPRRRCRHCSRLPARLARVTLPGWQTSRAAPWPVRSTPHHPE